MGYSEGMKANRPAPAAPRQKKLAAALKQNMARRKQAAAGKVPERKAEAK